MEIDDAAIRRDSSPILPTLSSKRKRGEVEDSESEVEEAASDQEFGWANDDATFHAGKLLE